MRNNSTIEIKAIQLVQDYFAAVLDNHERPDENIWHSVKRGGFLAVFHLTKTEELIFIRCIEADHDPYYWFNQYCESQVFAGAVENSYDSNITVQSDGVPNFSYVVDSLFLLKLRASEKWNSIAARLTALIAETLNPFNAEPEDNIYAEVVKALNDKSKRNERHIALKNLLRKYPSLLQPETGESIDRKAIFEFSTYSGRMDLVILSEEKSLGGQPMRTASVWELKAPQLPAFAYKKPRAIPSRHLHEAENQLLHYYDDIISSDKPARLFKVDPANIKFGGVVIGRDSNFIDYPEHKLLAEEATRIRNAFYYNHNHIQLLTWDNVLRRFETLIKRPKVDTASRNALDLDIHNLAAQWVRENYPYHLVVSLSEPLKAFVRHPSRETTETSLETLLFLMSAGLQHGGEWYYWVDQNLRNPYAPDQIATALTTGYDRVTYRALYALQAFDKNLTQKAIEKVKNRIKDSILKTLDEYVYQGKVLDYIREQQRSSDLKKAEKAAEIFREISSFCKTAPDFGADDRKRVFISYNHKDSVFVDSLRRLIEPENIGIIIDTEHLRFGDSINDFIGRAAKESDYTLAVISNNSLSSPWVIQEALETFMHEHVHGKTKYIPLIIDKAFYEDKFYVSAVERVDKGILELVNDISVLSIKGVPTTVLDKKKDQLIRLRTELGTVLSRLAENMYADCTTPENTERHIKMLCKQISEGEIRINAR